MTRTAEFDQLAELIAGVDRPALAVSGGVDSMTLALFCSAIELSFDVFHAISPAVPPAATQRVRRFARRYKWELLEIDANEFKDESYLTNPLNRCFYCKNNLYSEIRAHTEATIFSGTNLDDLSDFRPGLEAAAIYGVRHPYAEAGLNKQAVRTIARALGAQDLAELPSSPCLASRVETGLFIEAPILAAIDAVESWLSRAWGIAGSRCRVRANRIAIEVPGSWLARLDQSDRTTITSRVSEEFSGLRDGLPVTIESYRMGSAFVAGAGST